MPGILTDDMKRVRDKTGVVDRNIINLNPYLEKKKIANPHPKLKNFKNLTYIFKKLKRTSHSILRKRNFLTEKTNGSNPGKGQVNLCMGYNYSTYLNQKCCRKLGTITHLGPNNWFTYCTV